MSAISPASSAASPSVAAPSLAPAMQSSPSVAMSPTPGLAGSVTTREWVIPPRPKPGRKPATDTPPTKRKAQNRAAQRAFRERRAARVGELEDQMKQVEDEFDARELELKNQVSTLSTDLEQCQTEVSWWKKRCHSLEKDVARQRSEKEALQKQGAASSSMPDSVPINLRRKNRSQAATETQSSHQDNEPAQCGTCSASHCQCIEDVIQISNLIEKPSAKNDAAPQSQEPAIKHDPDAMEIDFTSRFSTARTSAVADSRATSTPPAERCGFCTDGTVCLCAEMADHSREENLERNRLAPMQNYSAFTPPPSDGDVRDVTLPPINQATNPCANGPGTCAQCQADPRSTLFCKTLAASRAAEGLATGCCGGKGADGGCCQSRPSSRVVPSRAASPLTLTCADAFTTLSRHPKFSQASDELTSWLPKLHTLPKPREPSLGDAMSPSITGRPALEVEAASVMGVLRHFDRRFASK